MRTAGMKKTLFAVVLSFLSLTAGLALCEAVLRFAYPRYAHIVHMAPPLDYPMRRHAWAWRRTDRRPDTHEEHPLVYNNLGGRQHRDFSEQTLREGVNVAFFGDSFTENRYIPAPYSFTEVLDYLLNAHAANTGSDPGPAGINVLNFGLQARGPGSQHAWYRDFPHKASLRHVFYVHCANDFVDVHRHGVWPSDGEHDRVAPLEGVEPSGHRGVKRWLAGLHLTYLAVDVWQRLTATDIAADDAFALGPPLRAGVLRWRDEVEANGGAFHVVLLPEPGTAEIFAKADWPASLDVLDLDACFRATVQDYAWKDWRFEQDTHWNEAGNMLAARCLYRFLEAKLGLASATDEALAQALHAYYRAFADDAGWQGRRFTPPAPWARPGPSTGAQAEAIRARYLATSADRRQRVMRQIRQRGPQARAGGWEVYTAPEHDVVLWAKSPCEEPDPAARLFLRVFATKRGAGLADVPSGVYDMPLAKTPVWRDGRECVIVRGLAGHPVAEVETGEYQAGRDGPERWRVALEYDAPETVAAALAASRRRYDAIVARVPSGRAAWNVYAPEGSSTSITYLKAPCDQDDLNTFFFTHMLPSHHADMAWNPSVVRGDFVRGYFWPGQRGQERGGETQMFDGKCIMDRYLPGWRVATVSTGACAGAACAGDTVLWETTFHIDTERFRDAWRSLGNAEPAARGLFDVHHTGDRLVYIRRGCAAKDVRARFFLHVYPRDIAAFAHAGRHLAFGRVALDFDFAERGLREPGRCVAVRRLPEYDIARIRTGQFAAADAEGEGGGQIWAVDLQLP